MANDLLWLQRGTVYLLVCLLSLNGCTSVSQRRQLAHKLPDELPAKIELTHTPFYPQTEHHCGPAALATVLQLHQVDITLETLSAQTYIPERKGSLQVEISVSARRYGMLPYPLNPELSDILREVAAGNPVLVLQNLGFGWWPQWHYAVVIGYDIASETLILRSGKTKRWETTFTTFENTWNRADNWALVILPVGEIPSTADISTYLKSAYAFEQTGLTLQALEAYRAATRKWPDDANTWLTLGNLAFKTNNSDEAVSALLQASKSSPETVIIWNNLAYALHRHGCVAQARMSLQCAYRLSPDDDNIRNSEQEISKLDVYTRNGNCPDISCN